MLSNELQLTQRLTLSASQIQALELLNYTNQELDDFLTREYLENPLLEPSPPKKDSMIQNLELLYENTLSFKDHYLKYEDEDTNRRHDIRATDGNQLQQLITEQLNISDFSKEEWQLITYMTQALDDKGFFTYSPDVFAHALGYPCEMVERCLEQLKQLEPAGIFSKDISECLKTQLIQKDLGDETLFLILEHHMDDLLSGHISNITEALHITQGRVRNYIHTLGTLNPRPLMDTGETHTEYIIPDVLVTRSNNTWKVTINDQFGNDYRLNDFYLKQMHETTDPQLKEYFAQKYQRATFLFNSIEQRRQTIIQVVSTILDYQYGYFEHNEPLKPMTMDMIAQTVGIHPSTVSRAIKGKYMQYRKIELLRDLFTHTQTNVSETDQTTSAAQIKIRIRELIASEDKKKPLSDQKIANLLKEEGIQIAKRTVTKYRQQEGILDSRQRKMYHR